MSRFALTAFALSFLLTVRVHAGDPVSFNRDVRPILAKKCFACHGPDEHQREAGLRLDQRQGALAALESGATAVVPGKPLESDLIARVSSTDDDLRMPPDDTLTPAQIDVLRRWIGQGAEYAEHWAFVKPVRAKLPAVSNSQWPTSPIDYFVLARLDREGLKPSPEADRYLLIRRLSLDLRGLPPTPDEVHRFVNDDHPDAYGRLVDSFLHDPAYGERWGRVWLDLARYADSKGYGSDPLRTIWRYRDWVIYVLNRNMPFDRFTIEQLAGDLLPDATLNQRIATAFHRNTMTNTEGGTDDEEFRVAAVRDRVDTTMQVWMGLTMGCAKCHNHKYDPISNREYYEFYAFLNQTADTDQPDERPTVKAPTRAFSGDKAPTVPVMQELSDDKRRSTYVMVKGNFLNKGDEVTAATPAAFHAFPENEPRNRLGLARWLVHPDNPLTARVTANRVWAKLFGGGLVETEEDFGTQGATPSHPELLDWLALDFRDGGWDLKRLLKTIVTSSTYRQTSRVDQERLSKDFRNRLYSRGPRFRLEAEMVRDQALALSGLLTYKVGGPSVYPPQPPGLWRAAFNGKDRKWATSQGADRYRRGLYTFWRRTIPYPSMATFDAPSREICSMRRIRTNTPLQAFVTLNDPVFVEASQALARRIVREGGSDLRQRVRFALRLCLVRPPTEEHVQQLVTLYQSERSFYDRNPADAKKLATQPLGPLPQNMDHADVAAWTVVANVLLNLDALLMKS